MTEAVAESIKIGIHGLSVPQGSHLCGFFRGRQERDDILYPFLNEGLRSGHKCLWAIDAADRDTFQTAAPAELDASCADQLEVVLSSDVYFGRSAFSVDDMIDYWDGWATKSLAGGGFPLVRAVGEVTGAVIEVMGVNNLVRYESELNRFAPRHRQVLFCLYDLDQFRGDLLYEILKTHPRVLIGSTVLENLYYVPPDEFVAGQR